MDIKEYIASGILETYAMGLTSAEESKEVERMAAIHPEVKVELQEVQRALEGYASSFAVQPPAHLKSKIAGTIFNEQRREAKVIEMRQPEAPARKASRFPVYAAAAAILLLIVSGIANYVLIQQLRQERDQSAAAMQQMNQRYASLEQSVKETQQQMAVMKDPRNKMVRLKGMDVSSASMATIYWNTASKEVYLDVNALPEPPQGMQYQLWAIVDGKPVDAGMIDMGAPGIHKMKSFDAAQAFAVTLEKAGGSPTPNLSAMYVMGNV